MRHTSLGCALSAAALTIALAGCATPPPPGSPPHAVGELPNQLRVTTVPASHAVQFAPGATAFSPREADMLAGFLRDQKMRAGEDVTLTAAPGPLDAPRRASVAASLRRSGLVVLAAGGYGGGPDQITVTVERRAVVLPRCPDWNDLTHDPDNTSSTNLGCATSTDLYMMVADPRDLVQGREMGPADPAPGIVAVDAYRSGKQVSFGSSGATSGGGGNGQ